MSLKFGTSGIRGLNTEFTPVIVNHYIIAFIQLARTKLNTVKQIALGGDLRESTPGIYYLIQEALKSQNCEAIDCGSLPTPALALYCIQKNIPGVMITGSHIPADRNGIKFYWPWGEILKEDETFITRNFEALSQSNHKTLASTESSDAIEAQELYISRYTSFFSPFRKQFQGKKIIVYQHSAVSRDWWKPILSTLGFEVLEVGRSSLFTPVDTETEEASKALITLLGTFNSNDFFAVVSSDGDGDRPFLCDEKLQMVRGDTIGILSAAFLKADCVVTPVSTNTALEKSNLVKDTLRTRIGSPYVIEAMTQKAQEYQSQVGEKPDDRNNRKDSGKVNDDRNSRSPKDSDKVIDDRSNRSPKDSGKVIIGFEANGGLMLGSDVILNNILLSKLPTRDSILPVLCCLALACEKEMSLSQLVETLPKRYTDSDVLREFPIEKKTQIFQEVLEGASFQTKFISKYGKIIHRNEVDGLRLTFEEGSILHFRPSGNAPEFRCYAEADTITTAKTLVSDGLDWLRTFYK